MKKLSILLALPLALTALSACPGDFSITEVPKIEITVEGDSQPDDNTAEVSFGQALQLPITRSIRIINPGDATLEISSIDWRPREGGGADVNQYVSLNLDASFPVTIEGDGGFSRLNFGVVFNPPLGKPLDDFSASVLVIESNAKSANGQKFLPAIEISFTMPEFRAIPKVNPQSYIFQNATPTKPERQTFEVGNDEDLATASFEVQSITLQQPSNVFRLENLPVSGTLVKAPNEPDYVAATFDVVYTPTGSASDQTSNSVVVVTSVDTLTVPLSTNVLLGNYSLSFSHVNQFDFSAVNTQECRRVIVHSEGPGPLLVKAPAIEPDEARQVFSWRAFLPATAPGEEEKEITVDGTDKFPRSLAAGRTIEFEICYAPGADPSASPNGNLTIPVQHPDPADIVINLFAGTPKPLLDLAPVTNAILVASDLVATESGVRHVVLYNNGNGDMTVESAETVGKFPGQDAVVFQVTNPTAWPQIVPAGGLLVVDVSWDASLVKDGDTEASEGLEIRHIHGFTGESTLESIQLQLFDTGGLEIPTADAGADYTSEAGGSVFLDGAASVSGSGSFEGSNFALWYLTAKPAASRAEFNMEGGLAAELRTDVEGTYTAELVVYAVDSGLYLFSDAATVTINAGPASGN